MSEDVLAQIEASIPVKVSDKNLLIEAFTHRSYINEMEGTLASHNERLEFLGDAVLDLVIADALFSLDGKLDEGEMTSYKSAIVRGESLANIALKNRLDEHIILGNGEERSGGRTKSSNLAGLIEAIIGAVYIDAGIETVKCLVDAWFKGCIDRTLKNGSNENPKGSLQHHCQKKYDSLPVYRVVNRTGPDHSPNFTVRVTINRRLLGEGKGKNVAEAERNAAKNGLGNI